MCVYYVICQNHQRIGPFDNKDDASLAAVEHVKNLDDHGNVSVIKECVFEGIKRSIKIWDFN